MPEPSGPCANCGHDAEHHDPPPECYHITRPDEGGALRFCLCRAFLPAEPEALDEGDRP